MTAATLHRYDRSPTPRRSVSALVQLELLSGFVLRCGGEPLRMPHSAQRVLALLALRGQAQPRARVAAVLWEDSTTDRANGCLRTALWRLRRAARQELVVVADDELWLADRVEVDVHRVRAMAQALQAEGADPDHVLTPRDLAHDILPGWDEEWVRVEREGFRQLRLHTLEALSGWLVRRERFGEAVGAAMEAVASDTLRESAHRALIGAYLAEGNRGEALRQYRTCHRLFSDELGLRPSDQLDELIRRALARP